MNITVSAFIKTAIKAGVLIPVQLLEVADDAARNAITGDELALLDSNSNVYVRVTNSAEAGNMLAFYIRLGGAWEDISFVVAGTDGSAANLANVSIGHVPVKGEDGINFEDSGISIDGTVVRIPASTLAIGNIIELSEGSGFIINANRISGLTFTVIDALLREAEGSSRPSHLVTAPATDIVIQGDEGTTMTTNPMVVDYTTQLVGTTWRIRLRAASAMNNVKIKLTDTVSGIDTRYLPSQLVFNDDTSLDGFNFRAGENTLIFKSGTDDPANGIFYVGNSVLRLFAGRTIQITLKADSVSLLGNGTLPYLSISHGAGVPTPLAYMSDIEDIQDEISGLTTRVSTLENTAFNSGRAFTTFNDGFAIDRTNIATFADKNIIYTAKNDKPIDGATRPDVFLPNDTEIQASGEVYPVTFEFTHLGGTGVFEDTNLLRLFVDGVLNTTLVRDQVAVVIKPAAGEPYEIRAAVFDPGNTILPTGVFNLKTDTPITNASDITNELAGVSIVAGDAYLVTNGGTWAGLNIVDDSVVVALVNSASLLNSETNEDWLLLDNPRVNTELTALLANYERDGILFNANRNITVDPANVLEFTSSASGVPIVREIGGNTQGQGRSIVYANVPIQLADIVGGRLQLSMQFAITSTSGFPPSWISMRIAYPSGITFDFPLDGAPLNGTYVSEIDIPNVDYSGALNQNATVSLFYNFNGVSFFGSYTIGSLVNMTKGRLNDAVRQVAQVEAAGVEMRLGARIDAVIGTVDQEDASIESLIPRVSPYENIDRTAPDVFARFLNSTGVDNYPSTVESMTSVSPENPRFTINNVAMYVAVRPQGDKALNNITASTSIILADSTPNVELGESITGADGFVYFIYRVTSLTSGNVFEVDTLSQEQVVAWQNSIDNLQGDVQRIDAELEHALLNLSDDVVQVFENDVTVTEENTPNVVASDYNKSLSGTNIQTIYPEANPNVFDGSELKSEAINVNIANDRYRNKLIYLPRTEVYTNKVYLNANDGTTTTDLIEYANGVFFAKVFVPAIPAGTRIVTIYPGIQNHISGPGIWNTLTTIPVQATEVFFVNDVPATNTGVTIQYRGHANGNIFGASSIVLPANQPSVSFILDDGSETATVEVLRRNGQIRVSVTERVNTGLPTINDVQVILSYQSVIVVPETPATVRNVAIENVSADLDNVFAIKPSAAGNLIIVGTRTEIDTGYLYTTLFAANESGTLNITTDNSIFFDYEDIDIITSTIVSLENHSILPQYGLFTTQYTHDTILDFSVQLSSRDDKNNVIKLGTQLIVESPNGTKYMLEVSNQGNLSTSVVP